MSVMDLLIQLLIAVVPAIASSIVAYLMAKNKAESDLKIQKQASENDITKIKEESERRIAEMKEQNGNEIKLLEQKIELESKKKTDDSISDITEKFITGMLSGDINPEKLKELENIAKKFNK